MADASTQTRLVLKVGAMRGLRGVGVPTGGAENTALFKASASDNDTEWRRAQITDVEGLRAELDEIAGTIPVEEQPGWINVALHGALPGLGDCLDVLQALAEEHAYSAILFLPGGTEGLPYTIRGEWRLPSGSDVRFGNGAFLRLRSDAAADQNCITNWHNFRDAVDDYSGEYLNTGDRDIYLDCPSVDGNVVGRFGNVSAFDDTQRAVLAAAVGAHTAGCGIGFSYVENLTINRPFAKNCVKHGVDVGAIKYSQAGDLPTVYQPGPSRNFFILDPITTFCGDDGVTTHHSEIFYIRNPVAYDMGRFLVPTNSNGCEIDDGSRRGLVEGGYALRCVHGLEAKAHEYAPAASQITVIGYTSEQCVRSFSFRHIAHRFDDEEQSESAKDLTLISCTSISPTAIPGLDINARDIVLHSYDGVLIQGFRSMGQIGTYISTGSEEIIYAEDIAPADINTTTDIITVDANVDTWTDKQTVLVSSTGSLPAPLVPGVFSYVKRISDTQIKLAASLTDLAAGAYINFTTQGSGVITLTQLEQPIRFGIHYKAMNVTVRDYSARSCYGQAEIIRVTGTAGGNIVIENVSATDCDGVVVSISGQVPGIKVTRIRATTTRLVGGQQPQCIFKSTYLQSTKYFEFSDIEGSGYAVPIVMGSDLVGVKRNSLEQRYDRIMLWDGTSTADQTKNASFVVNFRSGREILSARMKGVQSNGGWWDLYGLLDSTRPGQARFGSSDGSIDFVAVHCDPVIGQTKFGITIGGIFVSGGAGSPEGAVSAPQGSQWNRDNGTIYRKSTGTGNTGWVALS
jgi:hypothetical protein